MARTAGSVKTDVEYFFLDEEGGVKGPVATAHLCDLYASGRVHGKTIVWAEGQEDRIEIGEHPVLQHLVTPAVAFSSKTKGRKNKPLDRGTPVRKFRTRDATKSDSRALRLVELTNLKPGGEDVAPNVQLREEGGSDVRSLRNKNFINSLSML